jgi:transposase
MARFKEMNQEQGVLVAVHFDTQILPGSFEYLVCNLVDKVLDLSAFDAIYKNGTSKGGASAYDPRVLLKIIFCAYARGILSSRRIAELCHENVIFMVMACELKPHFTTIANFISSKPELLSGLFSDVLLVCAESGLIDGKMFAVDGCKLSSNASKEHSGNVEDFKRKKERYQKNIDTLMAKHKEEDSRESAEGVINKEYRDRELKAIENISEKVEKLSNFLNLNPENRIGFSKDGTPVHSNITDNESAHMTTSHGVLQGYNGVAMVDSKHQVVVAAEAFGHIAEGHTLVSMVNQTIDNMKEVGVETKDLKSSLVLADSGFNEKNALEELKERKIPALIADGRFRKRDINMPSQDHYRLRARKKSSKIFTPADFLKSPDGRDVLICPNEKELRFKTDKYDNKKGIVGRQYVAEYADCQSCPLRSQCTKGSGLSADGSKRGRQVLKKVDDESSAYHEMIKLIDTPENKLLYSYRMQIVEPVFAHIRIQKRLDRFTLRGKSKVNGQWMLFCTLHNMWKLLQFGGLESKWAA